MPRKINKNNSAFTLVELSIVLIIVGLIVGGVLAGQSLIRSARIQDSISQIKSFETSLGAFVLRYGMLPGDFAFNQAAANGFLARNGGLGCGDNNRRVSSLFVSEDDNDNAADFGEYGNCQADESNYFWLDMRDSGLMPKGLAAGANNPLTNETPQQLLQKLKHTNSFIFAAHGDMDSVPQGRFGYYFVSYQESSGLFNQWSISAQIPGLNVDISSRIDAKIDDGNPISGRIYTLDSLPANGAFPLRAIDGVCSIDNGGGVFIYDTTNTQPNICNLKMLSDVVD